MDFPSGWLDGHFDELLKRGAIIHFRAEIEGNDRDKFAIVLNGELPASDVHYIFTTTDKPGFYDRHPQFERALIRVPAGAYACFTELTFIPVRNPRVVPVEKLRTQFHSKLMKFCGALGVGHLAALNQMISDGFFIAPTVRPLLLPPESV